MAIKKIDDEELQRVVGGTTNADAFTEMLVQLNGVFAEANAPAQAAGDQLNTLMNQMSQGGAPTVTSPHDLLQGTDLAEAFRGGAGADVMFGGGGNDVFWSNDGDRMGDVAFGDAGDDAYVWRPGSGGDYFDGGAGTDTLVLEGTNFFQMATGSQFDAPGLRAVLMGNASSGSIVFINGLGQPQPFSGILNINGERVAFGGIERLMFGS